MYVEICGFPGYFVDRSGRIAKLSPYLIFKPQLDKWGYEYVRLRARDADGKNRQRKLYVHRLVAEAFVPNPLSLAEVNHVDGRKTNNTSANLEWVSYQGNYDHAHDAGLLAESFRRKAVVGTSVNGGTTVRFRSMAEAERTLSKTGTKSGVISECIKGDCARAFGYVWALANG